MTTSAPPATAEIVIGVQATAEGDWLICGLCGDVKYVPLDASWAAWERTSQWIALHRVGQHVEPLTHQRRD